jgi:hypothetical protein
MEGGCGLEATDGWADSLSAMSAFGDSLSPNNFFQKLMVCFGLNGLIVSLAAEGKAAPRQGDQQDGGAAGNWRGEEPATK